MFFSMNNFDNILAFKNKIFHHHSVTNECMMQGFNRLRKKIRRRRIETFLLAGYAFAITCALFVSLLNKVDSSQKEDKIITVEESYDFDSDIMTPAFNDVSKDNPFDVLFAEVNNQQILSNNEALNELMYSSGISQTGIIMPLPSRPKRTVTLDGIYQKEHRVVMINKGDNFIGILTRLGMEYQSANTAYTVLKEVFDAKKLQAGQHIEITATYDVQTKELESLDYLMIEPVRGTRYILKRNEYDKFEAKVEQEEFAYEIRDVKGVISGSVINSVNSAGVPLRLANKIPSLFAHQIDFKRDIQKGDSFEVKFEINKDNNDEIVKLGDILYAKFKVKGREYKLYRYKSRDGSVGYYDEKGGGKKSGLDKKPLAMKNARISSLFGYRRHPIYKDKRFHSGVDYAAPSGTAIYASGPGTVEMARYVNGYGNYIKIRHNSEYETAYGHMSRFASGIRAGVRVRQGQIIGYVGSTGRSTGPHLHFEILRKGQRIDPLNAKVATGNDLTGSQLAEFKRIVYKIDHSNTQNLQEKDVSMKTAAESPKSETKQQESMSSDAKRVKKVPPKKPAARAAAAARKFKAKRR